VPNDGADIQPPSIKGYVWKGILTGAVVMPVALALGGLAGVLRMEYGAKPWEHAIMPVIGGSCYGPPIGAALGLVFGLGKRLAWTASRACRARSVSNGPPRSGHYPLARLIDASLGEHAPP
jgi:hypothetical protein